MLDAHSVDGATEPRDDRRKTLLCALLVGAAAIAVYLGSVRGEFVYDDQFQILQNPYVLRNDLLWTALTSDVWAFRGESFSPYWRPAYTLWAIVNHRLFGIDPFGWRIVNILMHATVSALGFLLVRRMGLSLAQATAAGLLFAVHPVQGEIVAGFMANPDTLLAIGLFGALLCFHRAIGASERTPLRGAVAWWWAASLALAALAMLSKEIGVLTPCLIAVGAWTWLKREGSVWLQLRRAALCAVPYAGVAVLYLLARAAVLPEGGAKPPLATQAWIAAVNAPALLMHYFQQIVAPAALGPSHGLSMTAPSAINWTNFGVPLAAVIATGVVCWWLGRRAGNIGLAAALFFLPIAPVLNITAFPSDQLVHDRYLYVPLLGAAAALVMVLGAVIARISRSTRVADLAVLTIVILASAIFSVQTVRYSRAWTNNLKLWQWGVHTDPSCMNHTMLAVWLHTDAKSRRQSGDADGARERMREAREHFEKSFELCDLRNARLGRSELLMDLGMYDEAEADLRALLERDSTDFDAYDRLAKVQETRGRPAEAEQTLRDARDRVPSQHGLLTQKLAIILYQQGRKNAALTELEAVRERGMEGRSGPETLILYYLGLLYLETGRPVDGRETLEAFINVSRLYSDPTVARARQDAEMQLQRAPGKTGGF